MSDVTISLAPDGKLRLLIPSIANEFQTSSIDIAPTADGLRVIVRLLQARMKEKKAYIGTDAHPTRSQVDAWLAAEHAQRAAEAKERAAKALADIDVTLASLDLDLDL